MAADYGKRRYLDAVHPMSCLDTRCNDADLGQAAAYCCGN